MAFRITFMLFVLQAAVITSSEQKSSVLAYEVKATTVISAKPFDSVVLVYHSIADLFPNEAALKAEIEKYRSQDESISSSGTAVVRVNKGVLPGQKLVLAPTGLVTRDQDDVRTFSKAAEAGITRALTSGSTKPLLVVQGHKKYGNSALASLLGAMEALYTPLEVREFKGKETAAKATILGVYGKKPETKKLIQDAIGIESGRYVAKDICGSDPVRMAPKNVADYVTESFKGSKVSVKVMENQTEFETRYPLLAAVNRASLITPKQHARVIWLEYEGKGQIKETIMLVGKMSHAFKTSLRHDTGITMDTGGLDIKTSMMYSMSRDKCGAAAVAGFFKSLETLKPKGIKAVGVMAMVRNSVGSDSFSCDEIITSRAGKRLRIFNTDAEGRLVMMDPLFEMKERALKEKNAQIYTIATLTGAAWMYAGVGYTVVLDNGPAREAKNAAVLQSSGESLGDMMEMAHLRKEDYINYSGKTEYEDLMQLELGPRGHQGPMALLMMGSGLDEHGTDSQTPLKFTHLDMAGNAMMTHFPHVPPGSPVTALVARHVLKN